MIDGSSQGTPNLDAVRRILGSTRELPAMPDVAQRLLRLSNDPAVNTHDVVSLIESDPSLTAQILRYARSPFFGYHGEITSVQQAINSVLGLRMTLDLALGISLGKTFNVSNDGPLGLHNFWRHSVYCAALCDQIARIIPARSRPTAGLVFLCGLLHNLGILVIGQLFSREFFVINQMLRANPEIPVIDTEKRILNTDHTQVGLWLTTEWNLPAEIRTVAAHHHNCSYDGEHAVYCHLVTIANRLLQRHGIGDERTPDLPPEMLTRYSLATGDLEDALGRVMAAQDNLDPMARRFSV